mgnify:CR=1 FL=1|jgi:hypothetical protein
MTAKNSKGVTQAKSTAAKPAKAQKKGTNAKKK